MAFKALVKTQAFTLREMENSWRVLNKGVAENDLHIEKCTLATV